MFGVFQDSNLFLQGFICGIGSEPDDDHAESVNQRHHRANAGIVAAEKTDERAREKKSGGGAANGHGLLQGWNSLLVLPGIAAE